VDVQHGPSVHDGVPETVPAPRVTGLLDFVESKGFPRWCITLRYLGFVQLLRMPRGNYYLRVEIVFQTVKVWIVVLCYTPV
jgi:hypothetical protein